MQKLSLIYGSLCRQVRSEQGSALVGAVAFSIILFIASLGYLQVVASSRNYETTGFWDDKAFTAAESGLLLGAKWLSQQQQANDEQNPFSLITPNPREVYALTFDGIPVSVSISFSHDTAEIRSVATTGMLTYKKQLSRKVLAKPISAGSYGVYLDNAWSFSGNTKGIRKMDWDGPAHFNTPLKLGNQEGPGNQNHFSGKVTLYNIDPITNQPIVRSTYKSDGHFGNDYRYGVDVDVSKSNKPNPWNGDDVFLNTYNPNANKIVAELNVTGTTNLYLNASDSGLVFGVSGGNPFYQYRNNSGVLTTVPYNAATELKLHIANKGVQVSGTMEGKATVYTDPGYTIHIPGNLTYADFSTTWLPTGNNTTPNISAINNFIATSKNILGLYSGNNFTVAAGTPFVTALMFAVNAPANTMTFIDDKSNTTKFTLFGSLAASGFWDSKQGNDQASFNHFWDRRALSAPGLGFERLDANNTLVFNLNRSTWTERNFK
jgi:hypothetical protein